jgi:hypothetical protein
MAGAAIHFAFKQGMRKRFERFSALQLMAVVAHFGLSGGLQHRISGCVTRMTIRASDFIVAMSARAPAQSDIAIVATKTHTVLHAGVGSVKLTETDYGWTFFAPSHSA